MAQECGRRWRALDEHTKSKYREQQQLAQDIYYEKYRKYTAEKLKEKELDGVNVDLKEGSFNRRQSHVPVIPQTHEDYFTFLESSWREVSLSMPGLSPPEVQTRVWKIWQRRSAEESHLPQNPVQFCEGDSDFILFNYFYLFSFS